MIYDELVVVSKSVTVTCLWWSYEGYYLVICESLDLGYQQVAFVTEQCL